MLIEAAGKTWIVEEQELTRSFWSGGERFSGVTFRNLEYASEELYVSWAHIPERLTTRLAEELFEIAGVRVWKDPRDSRVYRLQIEANSTPAVPSDRPAPLEAIRFESGSFEVETPWTLPKPLGWATDSELMQLLDEALADLPSRDIPKG